MVTPGTTYQFSVAARNVLGWGPWSTATGITAAAAPGAVPAVSTSVPAGTPTVVRITWTAAPANSDALTAYEILIRETGGVQYSASASCDGSLASVRAAGYCEVPFTVLRSTPHSLGFAEEVIAKVRASNGYGPGPYSAPSSGGATIETEPVAMGTPVLDGTTLTTLDVSWPALTGTDVRGSAIDSYELSSGTGLGGATWAVLQGGLGSLSTALSHQLTSATPGTQYRFRLRAHNLHGWSPTYSPTLDALAAQPPAAPAAVTTVITGSAVRIDWSAPSSNFQPILAYDIEILSAGSTYHADLANCAGSAGSTVVTNTACDIPMTVLRAAPYLLLQGDLVVARVRASNSLGDGPYSLLNTAGALIQVEPHAMATPLNGPSTGASQVEVTWTALTAPQNGDSAVTSYELQWDAGSSGVSWVDLAGVSSNYLLTSYVVTTGTGGAPIPAGTTYQFRVRAANAWGAGDYSPVATILAADVPLAPAAPTTAIEATAGDVVITWVAPDAQGSALTTYLVEIEGSTPGAWSAETTYCGGSTAVTCQVPMSVFWAGPYSLGRGATIAVRVTASNAYGAGPASPSSTGAALVRVLPDQMAVPARGAGTSISQLELVWTALAAPNNGDSAITSYNLQWRANSGAAWADLVGQATPSLATSHAASAGVSAGTTAEF